MTTLQFEPPLPLSTLVWIVTAVLSVTLLLRWWWGDAVRPARGRWGLTALRLTALVALVSLLAGPVWINETPGLISRPDLFFLLDCSQSMDIGPSETRFQSAISAIDSSIRDAPADVQASVKLFQFGHRLAAVEPTDDQPFDLSHLQPRESDSRLTEALRQLLRRFGREPPAGIVLFSDGRVRDVEGVQQLVKHYAEQSIPIHVYPPAATAEAGDVSIVSVVAPRNVRKYSDVNLQVFLRSSGYAGQRLEVQLVIPAQDQRPEELLASVPVTLKGGAQSVPLTFRSDLRSRHIEVRAVPFRDELSTKNNVLQAEVQVERPKIRVLYIEGSLDSGRPFSNIFGVPSKPATSKPFASLRQALQEDEDLECVTLVRDVVGRRLSRPEELNQTTTAFPRSQAELSAYDCVILSDVPHNLFTDEQISWLVHWVENRGGGLLMAGGEESFAAGGWDGTPLADVLPVHMSQSRWSRPGGSGIISTSSPTARNHPVWQIVVESELNRDILAQLPKLPAAELDLQPKPLTEVLAVGGEADRDPTPQLVTGHYGRGRTFACGWPMATPDSDPLMKRWGSGGSRYGSKFWRNVVYWLTESSSIGRRRLIASVDKRFYRPGETISLTALAYDETAHRSTDYAVWGMIEPKFFDLAATDASAPVHWPNGIPRESGEKIPRIQWGEEFELPRDPESGEYRLPLELSERLTGGRSDEGFRIELTAYEQTGTQTAYSQGTQVDSTSIEIQILDDPFEQQNTLANRDLLRSVASVSGGQFLEAPDQLAQLIRTLPKRNSSPMIRRTPAWSLWPLLAVILGLWTVEWLIRRRTGLA
ncbi:MAG: glutamine amidotransferase [Planctomycetaceae bacterium]